MAARTRRPGHVRAVDRARLAGVGRSAAHVPSGPHQRRAGQPAGDGRSRARAPARHGHHRAGAGVDRRAVRPGLRLAHPRSHRGRARLRRGGMGRAHRRRDRRSATRRCPATSSCRWPSAASGRDRRVGRGAPGVPPPRPRGAGGGPGRRVRPVRRLPRRRAAPPGGRCEGARRYALGALARRRPSPAARPGRAHAPDRRAGRPGERPGLEARPPPGPRRAVVLTGGGRRLHRRATTPPSSRGCGAAAPPPCDSRLRALARPAASGGARRRAASGFDPQRARRAHSMQSTLSGAAARRAGAIGSPQPSQTP